MDSRDKKAFEIFLQAIQGVSSEDQLFKLMQRFDAKHKEKMAGKSLDEMLVNAVEHLKKQGQGHKWDRGSSEDQLASFSKEGFEKLLKYMPELKKVWQGHSQDSKMFLPEESAMATLDVDKVMGFTDPAVEQYYDENTESLEQAWEEHIANNDWGSGEDRITITDQMFFEFVEEKYYNEQEEMVNHAETEEELDALSKHFSIDIDFDTAKSDIGHDYAPFDVQTEGEEFFGYTEVDNEHEAEKLELEAQKLPEVTETVSYEEDGKWCVGIKGPVH